LAKNEIARLIYPFRLHIQFTGKTYTLTVFSIERNFMQATMSRPNARAGGRGGQRSSFKGIGRAIRYLTHYCRQALFPYIFLIIVTLCQLAVPHMVRNVIDAVTTGYIANQISGVLDKIPPQFMSAALPKILEATGKDKSLTVDQLKVQLAADVNNAPHTLIN